MGKYKQWLHHQEVGARLRDEIAAHEAERERVLKLAPAKPTSLPSVSNPLIAALLGQKFVTQTKEQPADKAGVNGTAAPSASGTAGTQTQAKTGAAASAASSVEASAAPVKEISAAAAVSAASKVIEETSRGEASASQDDGKTSKGPKTRATSPSGPLKDRPASSPTPAEPAMVSASAAQPDTIDPLLAQLLAQAESAPGDPLEALNMLASQGPNLTRGEAPQSMVTLPTSPFTAPLSAGQSAISALMGEPPKAPEAKIAAAPVSMPVAVGVETVTTSAELTVRTEGTLKAEKGRSDTDELVAARPTEGYTEPRLIVPQWLKSMELGQEPEGEKGGESEDAESKQRFSVSLPFENEEDMRLHESVERWWQRWRQQS